MLARVERQGDDEGAVKLQRSFKIIRTGEPVIEPAVSIRMFTNQEPITVDVFNKPMVENVLASAPDIMTIATDYQKNVMTIADFVAQSEASRTAVDNIIKGKAIPALIQFIGSHGDKRGGWIPTTGKPTGFGEEYWFRTAANFAGIWWNTNGEVVYFIGEKDQSGEDLNGNNSYVLRYRPDDLPQKHAHAYWSLTLFVSRSRSSVYD